MKKEVSGLSCLIRKFVKTGIRTNKPFSAKPQQTKCLAAGCGGTVGVLWPISLIDGTAPDGAVTSCVLVYPCDKCGALHNSPNGEGRRIIEDREGNRVFFQSNGESKRKQLIFKNTNGRKVKTLKRLIRGVVGG